jgi:hypothetical protein
MLTLLSISITCWLCALVAVPHRPLPDNEVAERVYSRLLGRRQRLLLLALLPTGAAFVALVANLPQRIDPDLEALRTARHACTYPATGAPICPILLPGGEWVHAEVHVDGSWRVVPTATGQGVEANPLDDPKTLMR